MHYNITHPTAAVARGIENLIIACKESDKASVKAGIFFLARLASITVFPAVASAELIVKRIPKALFSIPLRKVESEENQRSKFEKNLCKVQKFTLGILLAPLGVRSADGVSGFFLKTPPSDKVIRPFGVEAQYGKTVDKVHYPKNKEELQALVKQAIQDKKQISVIGAGMSQGTQTVPVDDRHLVIHTKFLNKISFDAAKNTATVGSGTTWEQLQIAANKIGKSSIVKQASDPFSIGGSIGINCHGWAHENGAIASTVESLEIIDAEGNFRTLKPQDELFGCMFGTLGYFGIVVNATLKITDNEHLIEKSETVDVDQFHESYQSTIKGHDIPLFGGRLVLDQLEGNPLRNVEMVRYEKDEVANAAQKIPLVTSNFVPELKRGFRMERIAIQAIAHFSQFTVNRLISSFWNSERKKMHEGRKVTRNEALHPPINAFFMLHHSNLHAQWLQEYFIQPKNLPNFLRFLGAELKANGVRLINATIRPTPKDDISILPYAEQDRYAVVLCFDQKKSPWAIARTKQWIETVNKYVIQEGDIYYQAYMPYATQEQFEACYGKERVEKMRDLKAKYDPQHVFGNAHTAKYFDKK